MDEKVRFLYSECLDDPDLTNRSNQQALKHMELTNGVTNSMLASDIKECLAGGHKRRIHFVPPTRDNIALKNHPASSLVPRRLSDFYNKQEMLEADKSRKMEVK